MVETLLLLVSSFIFSFFHEKLVGGLHLTFLWKIIISCSRFPISIVHYPNWKRFIVALLSLLGECFVSSRRRDIHLLFINEYVIWLLSKKKMEKKANYHTTGTTQSVQSLERSILKLLVTIFYLLTDNKTPNKMDDIKWLATKGPKGHKKKFHLMKIVKILCNRTRRL